MYKKPSLTQRLRYAFDTTLARGPAALIGWLALATFTLIVLAVAVVLLTGGSSPETGLGPKEIFWNILFQALVPNPPGNFDSPLPFLLVMLGVTLASLIMVSILIGLLSAAIQNRIELLRRGRSRIIENHHTVILGWSEQVFTVISELVIANENQRDAMIAILGEKDQVEMEDDIRHRLGSTGRTRVICRRGSPTEYSDIDLVSPQTSKSIIVLPTDDAEPSDSATIKTILALTKAPNRREQPYSIVAVIRDAKNMDVARLVGRTEVVYLQSGEMVARLMAQTCRQRGLSLVYTELMNFAGDEIYFQAEPALVGSTFGDALTAYRDSAVIGLFTRGRDVRLNPPMGTVIADGDQIIAISEDDDTVEISAQARPIIKHEAIAAGLPTPQAAERTLILGWNWRASLLIRQLDHYVAAGSTVTVVAEHPRAEPEIDALKRELLNHQVKLVSADIRSRAVLDSLQVFDFDHVILLCYSDTLSIQQADAITLLTLLHLRDIADKNDRSFSLVSEMMDIHNRNLAESTRADDFIVSDRLISMIMTQVSENRALNAIFSELLAPTGTEIFLKPAPDYIALDSPLNFYTVVEAARRRGEIAIGYRLHARCADRDAGYGVVLNPDKSASISFAPDDRIIVLARD